MEIELHSRCDPQECQQNLQEKLEKRVIPGWIRDEQYSLRWGKGLRNPFVPYFQGKLEQAESGKVLEGVIRIQDVVRWGAIIWGAFRVLASCLMTVLVEAGLLGFMAFAGMENLRKLGDETFAQLIMAPVMLLSFPLLGAAIGVGFPLVFIWDGRKKRERMLAELEENLEAAHRRIE